MPRKKKVEEPVVNEEPKKSDAVVATEIEVKKTVRAAARKAKEAIEDFMNEEDGEDD